MERPLVFISVAFAIGIVFGKFISIPLYLSFSFLLVFLLIYLYALFQKVNSSYLILITFFLLGMLIFQIKSLPPPNDISVFVDKGYLTIVGGIDDAPRKNERGVWFPLKVKEISLAKTTSRATGTVYISIREKNPELKYGDRIKVRGILSQLQNYSNPLMPASRKAYSLYATFFEKLPGTEGNPLKKAALWFSQKFNNVLIKILPQKEASLLGSILLGTSVSPLPDDLKSNYRKAGLIHLLVVSGTQVSILIGVSLAIGRSFGLPVWLAVLVTSLFNLMLTVITGAGSSILRAAIMGEITLIGLLFERQKEFYTSLAISALILLVINPLNLFDIGFQLSFAATWALVYIAPVLEKRMPALLAISLAPLAATSPIIAFYFSQISFGAVISNLLVLPWVEFLVILGFSTTVLGFVFLPFAQVLGSTIWLVLVILDWVARTISSLPGACFYIKAPTLPIIIGYYVGLIVLVEVLRREERFKITTKRLVVFFLFVISVFVWNQVASGKIFDASGLTVTFLDVGQGDSILIEAPDGKNILIDGGGVERGENIRISEYQKEKTRESEDRKNSDPVGEKVVVPFLHRKGINHLDLVILTHPHADHLGGLNRVLEEIRVDQVLDSGQVYDSQAYKRFKGLIEANKIKYLIAQAGQVINFGENLKASILNPIYPLLGNTNSDSIVMRLVYGEISFLFAGDMEKDGEERVLQCTVNNVQSTVLKVGHHGSATSTSDEFLKVVSPKIAVISVGKHNRYHHPAQSTLSKLEKAGVECYRTDVDGAVVVKTDGKKFSIETQR